MPLAKYKSIGPYQLVIGPKIQGSNKGNQATRTAKRIHRLSQIIPKSHFPFKGAISSCGRPYIIVAFLP